MVGQLVKKSLADDERSLLPLDRWYLLAAGESFLAIQILGLCCLNISLPQHRHFVLIDQNSVVGNGLPALLVD